jgi:hypothetical protein
MKKNQTIKSKKLINNKKITLKKKIKGGALGRISRAQKSVIAKRQKGLLPSTKRTMKKSSTPTKSSTPAKSITPAKSAASTVRETPKIDTSPNISPPNIMSPLSPASVLSDHIDSHKKPEFTSSDIISSLKTISSVGDEALKSLNKITTILKSKDTEDSVKVKNVLEESEILNNYLINNSSSQEGISGETFYVYSLISKLLKDIDDNKKKIFK